MQERTTEAFPIIVAPTTQEFSAVQKGLLKMGPDCSIRLNKCGVGESKARLFCQNLDQRNVKALILIGWAGGITPNLKAGDVVCASEARQEGYPPLECRTMTGIEWQTGPILTVPRALLTPEQKYAAQTSGAVAVEMEAYPMAEWAHQNQIPFLHVRVILDAWNEDLPDFEQEIDSSGKIHWSRLIKRIARQPALMRDLWQLSKRIQALNPILAEIAQKIAGNRY